MNDMKELIPQFGPFAGMRVIGTGSLIAMPFAISMLAEFGAEVIQIERPKIGDNYRYFPPVIENDGNVSGTSWIQEARNRLSMTLELNLNIPEVKEVFYELIKISDVYIENMVWLDKFGIDDEELLRINPKLVIVHISGYGNPRFGGVPEICNRGSYDMIGQAFSGYALYNGNADEPPMLVKPSLSDYITAMFALFGTLSAYINVQKGGNGQIVDVSQFEAQAKVMRDAFTISSTGTGEVQRCGSKATGFQPWDLFLSKDEKYVAIGAVGPAVYYRFLDAVGFDRSEFKYEEAANSRNAIESEIGVELSNALKQWCAEHSADEIERVMQEHKVPCSRINDAKACMSHPQYLLRDDFILYTDETLKMPVTAFGVFPKLSETPGAVWRGAPRLGQDTEIVLKNLLNYSDERIEELRELGII